MGAMNVAGNINPTRPTAPSPQQSDDVRQQQAEALMSLIQSQVSQQGQVNPNQAPIMPLRDLYQFLMSQGRRVYYTLKQ